MNFLDSLKKNENQLKKDGFCILNLEHHTALTVAKNQIEIELKKASGISEITLETYHHFFSEDTKHYDMQYHLLGYYRENKFGHEIIKSNLDLFKYILGPDLDIQREPYLRIARPGKKSDHIGYHRDTYYGTSPAEISIFVPFVNLNENNSLSMYPGSHILPDSEFQTTATVNKDVEKHSKRHQMGFLYAPKVMDLNESKMQPIPLQFGQVMIFMLSTIHGSVLNNSETTRWSTDIRIKNHATKLNEAMKKNYYEPLNRSVISECHEELIKISR